MGSIQPQPLRLNRDGTFDLDELLSAIKPRDIHFARTKLICVENTISGIPLPLNYPEKIRAICDAHDLKLHLDGARLANAACFHGVSMASLAQHFDSVSLCLSKGLGAPIGSVLVGDETFITEARRWRKMVGGGWRQAGLLAVAGQYALDNIDRTQQDHARAAKLAKGLATITGVEVDFTRLMTNMVHVSLGERHSELVSYLASNGVLISDGNIIRLVVHLDISDGDVEHLIKLIRESGLV